MVKEPKVTGRGFIATCDGSFDISWAERHGIGEQDREVPRMRGARYGNHLSRPGRALEHTRRASGVGQSRLQVIDRHGRPDLEYGMQRMPLPVAQRVRYLAGTASQGAGTRDRAILPLLTPAERDRSRRYSSRTRIFNRGMEAVAFRDQAPHRCASKPERNRRISRTA